MGFLHFLDFLTLPGVIALFFVLIIGSIFVFRSIIEKNSKEIIAEKPENTDYMSKKYDSVNINKFKMLIFNIGMVLSLSVILAAFEFPDFEEQVLVDLGTVQTDEDEIIEIPPTEQLPPPPPKIQQPEIIEVPDEEEIEEEIEVEMDIEMDEETVVDDIVETEEVEEEEDVDQIFTILENNAEYPGGMKAFYKFVGKRMKYPKQAQRMGIEGKVYVQFVIETNGKLTDIKVVRGIGGGADEEAIRVLKMCPKWAPGKQRGRAVRQRMVIPINFKLG